MECARVTGVDAKGDQNQLSQKARKRRRSQKRLYGRVPATSAIGAGFKTGAIIDRSERKERLISRSFTAVVEREYLPPKEISCTDGYSVWTETRCPHDNYQIVPYTHPVKKTKEMRCANYVQCRYTVIE